MQGSTTDITSQPKRLTRLLALPLYSITAAWVWAISGANALHGLALQILAPMSGIVEVGLVMLVLIRNAALALPPQVPEQVQWPGGVSQFHLFCRAQGSIKALNAALLGLSPDSESSDTIGGAEGIGAGYDVNMAASKVGGPATGSERVYAPGEINFQQLPAVTPHDLHFGEGYHGIEEEQRGTEAVPPEELSQ